MALNGDKLEGFDGVIPLIYDPQGLTDAQKAKWPHLANYYAYKIGSQYVDQIPAILKGQFAIAAGTPSFTANATSVQIPGVLDDLYTYTGPLGLTWNGDVPTLRLWAPTARAVSVQLATPGVIAQRAVAIGQLVPDIQGTWVITLDGSFKGASYLYDVEVYVPSTGQVEHNMVTDPYAVGLTMNSDWSLLVDLNDPALKPASWAPMAKPPLAAPEDIVLYELHMRDFSVNDASVPAADRGKYKAFTLPGQQRDDAPEGVGPGWTDAPPPAARLRHRHDQRRSGSAC